MNNMKLNILSTTTLLTSNNDKNIFYSKLFTKKQELTNRIFGKGKNNETL